MAHLMSGVPYSLHLHGDLMVYGTDHAQKMQFASFIAAAAKPMQRQLVESVGVPEERTHTMWMGVDTGRFVPRLQPRAEGEALELVTVARLNPAKGHQHALAAIRRVIDDGIDVRYSIVGSGPERERIEMGIQRLGLRDHVRMQGSLGEDAVARLLQRSHVFILPSTGLGEASPVAVMEAMACGVPAISSIIGGTPEMISAGVDGLLVPQADEQALADAITLLARDEVLRQALSNGARERAVSSFDCRVTAKKLLAAVERARPH
jgi:glycosyltransferase involved in cell wall biosynthesis